MVFSTIIFLFRFLPITLALYYLAPAKLKNTVLFVCSLVFYCWGEVRFFPVMLALILINYLCGLGLEKCAAKPAARTALLLAALAGSLGMLFYFKYANFVLSSLNALLGTDFCGHSGHQHPAAGHQLLHLPDPVLYHRCLPGARSRPNTTSSTSVPTSSCSRSSLRAPSSNTAMFRRSSTSTSTAIT